MSDILPNNNAEPTSDILTNHNVEPTSDLLPNNNVEPARDILPNNNVEPTSDILPNNNVEPTSDILMYPYAQEFTTIIRVYILGGSACFLGVVLVVTSVYWSNLRHRIVAVKETELGYKGHVLSTGKYGDVGNTSHVKGLASEIIENEVAKAIQNLYNDNAHPEEDLMRKFIPDFCTNISRQTPILKLEDIDSSKTVSHLGGKNVTKIFWKSQHESYDQSRLTYNDAYSHVHIAVTGLYFIMSQIRTKIQVTNNTQSSVNVRHCVHHISNNTENIILENVKTLCEPSSKHADRTSSVGAIFKLNAHDQIYVSTSHPDALVAQDSSNHVTIFVY